MKEVVTSRCCQCGVEALLQESVCPLCGGVIVRVCSLHGSLSDGECAECPPEYSAGGSSNIEHRPKLNKRAANTPSNTRQKAVKKAPANNESSKKTVGRKELIVSPARTPNRALMKKLNVSPALAAVIGAAPATRTEIVKKLWDYIKQNGLQDTKNRRMINSDVRLKPVFGGRDHVSLFDMTRLVSEHCS